MRFFKVLFPAALLAFGLSMGARGIRERVQYQKIMARFLWKAGLLLTIFNSPLLWHGDSTPTNFFCEHGTSDFPWWPV